MMARTVLVAFVSIAAAMLTATPFARAQCRLCEAPSTGPKDDNKGQPVELEVQATLDFDRIVVLQDGQVIQEGTPDELLHRRGPYRMLIDDELARLTPRAA